ncbi:hypothetical protein Hhal_0320 [Halorhodospira halophila SL1]|uniref:Uncharacterized protein n=1 Tax=Halorhodospira halophila (strain DSM 244 / SL1) TaxID=349124 RepID=A1WTV2_HALHL|nr:hypothetical protein Hhal_0320 [Halorhodospira halophila SL1]
MRGCGIHTLRCHAHRACIAPSRSKAILKASLILSFKDRNRNIHAVLTAVRTDVYHDFIVRQAEKYEIIDFIVKMGSGFDGFFHDSLLLA